MKVNMGTKKAEELIHDFTHRYYKGKTIYDVYSSISSKKATSWRKIEEEYKKLDGWELHITGANCYYYSCIYAFKNDAGNIMLRKETKVNQYDLEMTPEEYKKHCAERMAIV